MKKALCLMLACLMLCGCEAQTVPQTVPTEAIFQTAPPETRPVSLYAPGHPLEQAAPGALRIYPLETPARKLILLGGSLLLVRDNSLCLLAADTVTPAASVPLDFPMDAGNPSLRVEQDALSYYDPVRRETVILSHRLKEVGRIAAPEGMIGNPILSADRNTLYYCTANAIRAWDLETGVRRCVKEMAYEVQELTGLHQSDTILQCRISDGGETRTLFLSAETGQQVEAVTGEAFLKTGSSGYCAEIPEGGVTLCLFGEDRQDVRLLTPRDLYADRIYLEDSNQVLTLSRQENLVLDCYELNTGLRRASLTLAGGYRCLSAVSWGDAVFLLLESGDGNALICRWDSGASATQTGDSHRYTGPRYTRKAPDSDALAACQAEAARIGEKYGIQVLVWEDALSVQPWDYTFQTEYLAPVLRRELSDLDRRLAFFPPEILEGIRSHFGGLTICLVRDIRGAAASGSLQKATGVQFRSETSACIAIAVGQYAERALYHEMYHAMETRLLTDSAALDRWDSLNPKGFFYDLDYAVNAQRRGDTYLQADTRAFIDTYSMSFPKEDRARILECAMRDGCEDLFRSDTMQNKLQCLSQAIREAYGLKKSTEVFRWEQYLK